MYLRYDKKETNPGGLLEQSYAKVVKCLSGPNAPLSGPSFWALPILS